MLQALEKALLPGTLPSDLKRVIGILHRVRYRASDDYRPDLSYHGGAFPGLPLLCGQRSKQCSERFWLMLETQFIRQHDRACELFAARLDILKR